MIRLCRCKRIVIVIAIFALTAVASPVNAQIVPAGIDLFETPPGSTSDAFNSAAGGTPIPAGFFDPTSAAFDGAINLQGNPLGGFFANADTIVERLAPVDLTVCPGPPQPVPIEIVALDLVSSSPIDVTIGGNPTQWDVRVCLSDVPQVQGQMTITKTHSNGGIFTSDLPVQPKFIFTRVGVGTVRVFDTGNPPPPAAPFPPDILTVDPADNAPWVHTPYNAFGVTTVAPGQSVDRNCDGNINPITEPALPGTSNFVPGVGQLQSDCNTPPIDPNNHPPGGPGPVQKKVLTIEQALLAAHGILPAEEGLIDCCLPDKSCTPMITSTACALAGGTILPLGSCTAPEACCLPDGTCIMADPICCLCNGGKPQGPGSDCTAGCEACCLPGINNAVCMNMLAISCIANSGRPCGPGTFCLGDNDGDGVDDICPVEIVPAVSNIGLVLLVILVLAAGVIAIRRGRRASAVG